VAIPSRQIGWDTKSNLLWQISKQFEYITQIAGNIYIPPVEPTTTTTTSSSSTSTSTTTSTSTSSTTSTTTTVPPTTTTTTSSSTSTTTTTTTDFPATYFFEATVDNSVSLACLGGEPQTLYTASRIVTIGSFIYQNVELTIPFTGYFSINAAPTNYYECYSNGEVVLIEACPILSYDFIATENNNALITEGGDNLIMNYPLPTSEIITEDGNFVITENGDFLTTQ